MTKVTPAIMNAILATAMSTTPFAYKPDNSIPKPKQPDDVRDEMLRLAKLKREKRKIKNKK